MEATQYAWIQPGMTIKVHLKIKDVNARGEEKERIQIFEGRVIARKGNNDAKSATITVRKISNGVGVEKIFPLTTPSIAKIEPVKKMDHIRRAKLYYLRTSKKKIRETAMKTA